MATIYLSLSKKKDALNNQEVLLRFSHGKINQRAKSNVFVPHENWDNNKRQIIIPNLRIKSKEKVELIDYLTTQSNKLDTLIGHIQKEFNNTDIETISSGWLKNTVNNFVFHRGKTEIDVDKETIFDVFDSFLKKHSLSEVRKKNFKVVKRVLQRYELYKREYDKAFELTLDNITSDTLQEVSDFFRNEYKLRDEFPEIYKSVKEYRNPQPRSQNTINDMLTKFRTFIKWSVKNNKTENNPFKNYTIGECVYGTPFYITIKERNTIYETDFSDRPALERQRDIFVFQCLIGSRVGDYFKMTKNNLVGGTIQYVARKTKDKEPVTITVPLNSIAKEILDKYKDLEGVKLLPFISEQKYNDAIKEIFKVAGITRKVTVLDPLTREGVVKPINEVASSHLARRCFIGNLYKKVKDPNLVGSLSGHVEGSKAFSRYRDIDDEMKFGLVSLLEK